MIHVTVYDGVSVDDDPAVVSESEAGRYESSVVPQVGEVVVFMGDGPQRHYRVMNVVHGIHCIEGTMPRHTTVELYCKKVE